MSLAEILRPAPRSPVSVLVALGALGVTLSWWGGVDLSFLIAGGSQTVRQPWSLVTSVLPHVNVIHLYFNLYWWWYFAVRMEATWGSVRLLGATLVLAVVSSAAECSVSEGGVGLSGVVYGQFALLWVVQKEDERFRGIVASKTAGYFVAWFFLCIGLTVAGVWNVANVAHGAGAVAGYLLGLAVVGRGARRIVFASLLAACGLFVAWGATFGHGTLVLSNILKAEARQGAAALDRGDAAAAVPLLEVATRRDPSDVQSLTNLGLAYQKLGRHSDAAAIYVRIVGMRPDLRDHFAPSIASILETRAWDSENAGNLDAAKTDIEESLRWEERSVSALRIAGQIYRDRKEWSPAKAAYSKARLLGGESQYPMWEWRYDLASIAMRAGDHESAVSLFREVLEANADRLDAWFYIGGSLEALHRRDEAKDAYRRALDSEEVSGQARDRLMRLGG